MNLLTENNKAAVADFARRHWLALASAAGSVAFGYFVFSYNPVLKANKRKEEGKTKSHQQHSLSSRPPGWLSLVNCAPQAVVDLDAFDRNATKAINAITTTTGETAATKHGAEKKNIRIATKSIRCVDLISRFIKLIPQDRFAGLMCFSAEEVLQLARLAVPALSLSSVARQRQNQPRLPNRVKHILLAYPIQDEASARKLVAAAELIVPSSSGGDLSDGTAQRSGSAVAEQPLTIAVMVDCVEHVELLAKVDPNRRLKLWIDVDMAWKALFGTDLLYVGSRRSPLDGIHDIVKLAKDIVTQYGFDLEGIMGYEGQIAGLPDSLPSAGIPYLLRRMIKRGAEEGVRGRRQQVLDAIARDPELVAAQKVTSTNKKLMCNGGGSGSVKFTMQDDAVTEITLGSAALCGHQFDGYIDEPLYEPSLYFVLRATRQPRPNLLTCHGGGWVASGDAGSHRLPVIAWPRGASFLPMEGAGEVQTPIDISNCCDFHEENHSAEKGGEKKPPKLGDLIVFRHCKSGELGEVFATYTLVSCRSNKSSSMEQPKGENESSGGCCWEIEEVVPTYRGQGIHSW